MNTPGAMAYVGLLDVTRDAADAWFHWAAAIETEGLSAATVREVILGLIGEFVWLRFLECIQSKAYLERGGSLDSPHFRLSEPRDRHLLETQLLQEMPSITKARSPNGILPSSPSPLSFHSTFLERCLHERDTNELPVGD